jgi:DNA-binding NtrC family response regulator
VADRVLIAAVDRRFGDGLMVRLRSDRIEVIDAGDPSALRVLVPQLEPALVVIGVRHADRHRLPAMLREWRSRDSNTRVIVLAHDASESLAVAALRCGVIDYFPATCSTNELCDGIRRCLRAHTTHEALPGLVGDSAPMRELCVRLGRLAATDTSVLITGETGTGKELAAQLLHTESARRRHRFVAVNCAAIPDSLFESELFGHERGAFTGAGAARAGLLQQAQGGTIFLDEVGDMSHVAQAKMLRAIETRAIVPLGGRTPVPLDVRLVAATNQDLEKSVAEGRFRRDLYFRLNVVRLHVPPLRERRSDIPSLVRHYADFFAARTGRAATAFSDPALTSLQRHDWPGNVRELKNLVEAVLALGDGPSVSVADLPRDITERLPASDEARDREQLLNALFEARWNKSRAARQLRCSRMTLYRRMSRLHVTGSDK